jgi:hypothetical protein
MDGRAAPVFATMRRSIAIPPARSSTQNPGSPNRGFVHGNGGSGSIGQGWTFRIGCCRHMRRRNFWLGRILDRSGAAATVHRGLVADQHASRLARGDHIRWLYARRHPSGQPDRPAARPATLSRLERTQRAVLRGHGAVRQSAPGARILRSGRHRDGGHVYARPALRDGTPVRSPSARRCRSCSAGSERCSAGAALLLSPACSAPPVS